MSLGERKTAKQTVIATLSTGLDNFAFDDADNLFCSSYADGFISKVTSSGVEEILPGGISHPGALVIHNDTVVIADIQSVRAVDAATGEDVLDAEEHFSVCAHRYRNSSGKSRS